VVHMLGLGQDKMKILERSPKVGPLLARLYDRNQSYQSGQDETQERAELSSVMVDLLSLDLQPTESELVTDVLLELMRQAEHDLRQSLASRLAHMDGVPLRMVLHLANDEITVAEPILRNSPVLHDMDLIYIIKSHSADHWKAIAGRHDLTGSVINTLADTGDTDTAIALAENTSIVLTEYALDLFVPLAGQSEALAKPLLTRTEIPERIVVRLYEAVGEELKKTIAHNYPDAAKKAMSAIDEIVLEIRQINKADYLPSAGILNSARALIAKQDTIQNMTAMLSSLKRGMIPSFIAQLSAFADLPPENILEMLAQKNGQSLAVACKALDVKKADFISFYLMTHRIRHNYQQVIDHHQLSTAISTFDAIRKEDALRLLAQSRVN
jgi:uncharacterized protein (DUF2336 family)